MRIKDTIVSLLVLLAATSAQAQITIGGNVYGGGNEGAVGGNTTVTVHAGDLNEVYGGARLADVGGRAFVNIDGEHASNNIIITSVYGGNDIAGTIGSGDLLPAELADVPKANDTEETLATKNAIDNSWNAFIRTSPTPETDQPSDRLSLVVGSMFGGGNGDYSYTANAEVEGTYDVTIGDKTFEKIYKPELGKTYLEIKGGCIAHLYGGGDNATVTGNTTICIDNNSPVLDHTNVWPAEPTSTEGQAQLGALAQRMQMSTFQSNLTSYAFNFARVFGGNNKAPMAIRPTWNLKNGIIRDLYSGGNAGAMTYEQGILLVVNGAGMTIENVYGGCRMADVNPDKNDISKLDGTFNGVECHFPAGYAARLVIAAGNITNVYGGNDISGTVYGGNAVGIRTSVKGDIYGGGNGSYAYTDNKNLKGDPTYGDFYYDVNKILGKADSYKFSGMESAQALNEFRPNAERVSIRLVGKSENEPTIIHGSVYCGGNSATLKNKTAGATASAELKIGSYVIADHVFLGSNGENLIKRDLLKLYIGNVNGEIDFSQMNLASTDKVDGKTQFDEYMDAVSISVKPQVVFDKAEDGQAYVPYSTQIGSFYCGGNVGSVKTEGVVDINFNHEVIIFDKLVGGCNNANVPEQSDNDGKLNIAYEGGVLGGTTNGNKLILNLSGLKLQPMRWNSENTALIWNTVNSSGVEVNPTGLTTGTSTDDDKDRRLAGGNVYGGCYNSGHVNGNVVININETLVDRKGEYAVFDETTESGGEPVVDNDGYYDITKRRSGVILDVQGDDVLGKALNVFGGGYGPESEIWGSTTINVKGGYAFQVFGGGEQGPVGKSDPEGTYTYNYKIGGVAKSKKYSYNPAYSCYVNLRGNDEGVYRGHTNDKTDMAETEYLYGGAFEAPIAGDVVVRLGNGRTYQSFGGSCNADILGHTETYVGRQVNTDGTYTDGGGFPYIRDNVFGGNDLGGKIWGEKDFTNQVSDFAKSKVYKIVTPDPNDPNNPDNATTTYPELTASSYMEYIQGRVNNIFGGCYGVYDYTDPQFKDYTYTRTKNETAGEITYTYTNDGSTEDNVGTAKTGFTKPRMKNAFVNFKPIVHDRSSVNRIYGAGQGYSGDSDRDIMQTRSYILIDDATASTRFQDMQVFGAGESCGLGMDVPVADAATNASGVEAAAVIDLVRGEMAAAYGASFNEGITRRTIVNVPTGSTIKIGSIFGGGFGSNRYLPCDAYEANVNYNSADAFLVYDTIKVANKGAIYGGNNNQRRTLYGRVNITVPVKLQHIKYGTTKGYVYGAGCGGDTWAEYTEVNLKNGAIVYEVYGGGQQGKVYNTESVTNFMKPANKPTTWPAGTPKAGQEFTTADWANAWDLGKYNPEEGNEYWQDSKTNLANGLVRVAEMDDRDFSGLLDADKAMVQNRYTANVIINEGAKVENYAYGGGYGADAVVSGTTYIALLGGEVNKDIYAAGTSGSVEDIHGAGVYGSENQAGFVASANVYVKGGTVRNVYGGGWRGSVGHHGYHTGQISDVGNNIKDRDGEAHVVIGDLDGTSHTSGIPSITRNVYGGGEGGAIFGDAYVTVNKGYIGYRYNSTLTDENTTELDDRYVPELNDAEPNDLDKSGNVFGGGYVANSYVDRSHVTMMGGIVRGSLYGGGEIGPIGRGTVHADSLQQSHINSPNIIKNGAAIYKGGETHVELWDGHVMRDVFGGGRGYDNWGGEGYFVSEEERENMDRSSKGYVFGSTDVHIYGGEVGTEANVLKGYGNVFGGGNEGFVYSATGEKKDDGYYYDTNNVLSLDCNVTVEPRCKVTDAAGITLDKYYNKGEYVSVDAMNKLKSRKYQAAEWEKLDTRGVIIHNALFAGGNITEGSDKIFANTVTVYGNAAASLRDVYNYDLISLGTEEMGGLYGDGNLTLVDGFRELHIDNYGTDYYSLDETMVIGDYNQLTDRQKAYYKLKYSAKSDHTFEYYESIQLHTYEVKEGETVVSSESYRKGQKVTPTTYNSFSSSEQAHWRHGTKYYQEEDQIEEGEYNLMYAEEQEKWELWGVTSIYAGRPMNTIQRADFCGVFGSRMVMKGAVDRAPQVNGGVDYNSYTINRVDEVSLNKRTTQAGDAESTVDYEHGNYFGIYNSVKFLGNLTSDVPFMENKGVREAADKDGIRPDNTTTYYQWKVNNLQSKYRNNGISHNKVALASGVYLELKKEETENVGQDVWGYITGVVELDLINVMPGMGGGYVYAKNEHGRKSEKASSGRISLLTENDDASTYRLFEYTAPAATNSLQQIETSGNFIHNDPLKQIVDDCYPNGGIYNDKYVASPAHYWFIRGNIYVYDQYISAYTGAANATAEKQEIPLNITAASNGRMTLRDVQPNYYAYYDRGGNKLGDLDANADTVFVANNKTYKLNQPISYWDYQLLSEDEQNKFEKMTYVVIEDCKIGTTAYKKGTVLLESEYNQLLAQNPAITYIDNEEEKTEADKFTYFFRPSNNLSHNTGYVLTYDVNNPMVWNNYYTLTTNPGQANALNTDQYFEKNSDGTYKVNQSLYTEGPTYTLRGNTSSVFGQQDYTLGTIIYGSVVTNYKKEIYNPSNNINNLGDNPPTQALVERAWVVTKEHSVKENGEEVQKLSVGTPIYQSKYTTAQWDAIISAGAAEEAKVCTSLLEFSSTDYVWAGKVLSKADINELKTKIQAKNDGWTEDQVNTYVNSYLDDAYYCTSAGKYGGIYFTPGKAYRAIDTWCSMTEDERANFDYNYDAFDLLIDPDFSGGYGSKPQYDGTNTNKVYSDPQPIDYQAEFQGDDNALIDDQTGIRYITYESKSGATVRINASSDPEDWLSRQRYEDIPNEKRNYSPVIVTAPGSYYMVKTPFMNGETPYTAGQQIYEETYQSLSHANQTKVDILKFIAPTGDASDNGKAVTNSQKTDSQGQLVYDSDNNPVYEPKTYYYCRKGYTVDEKGEGVPVTTTTIEINNSTRTSTTYGKNVPVDQGVVIDASAYNALKNFQTGFSIHGTSPTEVSTLYISNESDIHDLSAEKIITVIYLYEYEESDETGLNVTPVSERHIMNIHINFKSGVPEIGDINKPDIVLPGTTLGMNIPSVTQGAFRVTESGWEIFSNGDDAATHYNGTPFYNNETPLYFYQDNYWLAYYAQTSLGRTYSKSVKLNVANYHDLKKVMDDKEHHYYIDHKDVKRQPKIYINDYSASGENGLDLFKDLIDLSYGNLNDHALLNSSLEGGQNLEFFLRTDLSHTDTELADEWTPIANGTNECFSGNFHGEGHTISGLDNSLFNHLCGSVYNLGVTGSFTGAGIAETGGGYVENCWISTSSTNVAKTSMPVFGNPTGLTTERPYRIVNCYYQEDDNVVTANKYNNHPESTYGIPTRKDSKAFYNGEVAYDLNGFYLYKRYCDHEVSSGNDYQCFHMKADGTAYERQTKHYGTYDTTTAQLCSSGYVENRYEDGDFRFAEGSIPSSEDKRAYTVTDTNNNEVTRYAPIWPHDYTFFGQSLTFDYSGGHQSHPTAINKNGGFIVDGTGSNHVHRAPAYFGSSTMGVAHFNPVAILAAYSNPPTETSTDVKEAYPGMTAIDFAGHNDTNYTLGLNGNLFYQPLLDDDGLYSIENKSETRNLLVYAPSSEANSKTYTVLNGYFTEAAYSDYASIDNYGSVGVVLSPVFGHLVQSDLTTTSDHLLVDKQDFDCPIPYTMGGDYRMWYQRTPDNKNFVTLESGETKGWDVVSLPFEVQKVTTQQKGEISHFYNYKDNSTGEDDTTGHEYWLREFAGNVTQKMDQNNQPVEGVFTADFNSMDASKAENTYTYNNTFLWDYYYKQNPNGNTYGDDANSDDYKQYYNESHTFNYYPLQQPGTAYLIGFPGASYYEFDLSGQWKPANTASPAPGDLNKQTITFASATGVTIKVSDTEKNATAIEQNKFMPNYLTKKLADKDYLLNAEGNSFDKISDNSTTVPFRPYLHVETTSQARGAERKDSINHVVFGGDVPEMKLASNPIKSMDDPGDLIVKGGKKKITVESQLRYTVDVRIVTPAGITLSTYAIEPGEIVETRVQSSGVYIVEGENGRYVKKVIVK